MPKKAERKLKGSSFHVGQRIMIPSVGKPVPAEIIEDRGFIGHQGRQLLRVRTINQYPEDRREREVPAEEVTPVE